MSMFRHGYGSEIAYRDGADVPWYRGAHVPGRGGTFATAVGDDGRTRQEFVEECDINNIMARFKKTGMLPVSDGRQPAYLDVSNAPDLMVALQVMTEAEASFMRLPAKVRAEFGNDPLAFVKFAQDEANIDVLRGWGLAKPLPEAATPAEVVVVDDRSKGSGGRRKAADAPSDA